VLAQGPTLRFSTCNGFFMKTSTHNCVDDVSITLSAEKIIEVVTSKTELTWGALIDTAFDHSQVKKRLNLESAVNCYDFLPLRGLTAVAPCLISLSPDSNLRTQVTRLIRHCQGRPMLSFFGSTESLREISERWREVHTVSVVDGQEMLLRFADTRVLSYTQKVLTSQQWAGICGAISHWLYFDRSGGLVKCDIPSLNEQREKILITKDQLEKFLDESYPDALIALITESMCEIFPTGTSASERYYVIKDSYELSKKHEINNSADVLALAVGACLTEGKSNVDQRLESLLRQRTWSTGLLGDAMVNAEIL